MSDVVLPNISDGALTLLAIALSKDSDKSLTSNAALESSLALLAELPGCCARGPTAVQKWLAQPALPPALFGFCAELLDRVEREVKSRWTGAEGRWSGRTEFDHPALLALGQTVARSAGMNAGLGPPLNKALTRLAGVQPRALQHLLLENYFGNILQDYFDACEVRRNVPDLPDETEERLRKEDARAIADWLIASVSAEGPVEPARLRPRMAELMTALFLEEARRR